MSDEIPQDKIVLSPIALSHQICSICRKYLSVGPIHLLQLTRKAVCGRCSTNYAYLELTPSIFNDLAENFLYHCINYYGGCKKLLQFNEAMEHEKNCNNNNNSIEKLKCPVCNFHQNNALLFAHLRETHKCQMSEDGKFDFNYSSKSITSVLYFAEEDQIFFLVIYVKDDYAYVLNKMVTPQNDNSLMCNLTFCQKNDRSIKIRTPNFKIFNVAINAQCQFPILHQRNSNCRDLFLQCSNYFRFNIALLNLNVKQCYVKIELIGKTYDFESEITFLQCLEMPSLNQVTLSKVQFKSRHNNDGDCQIVTSSSSQQAPVSFCSKHASDIACIIGAGLITLFIFFILWLVYLR